MSTVEKQSHCLMDVSHIHRDTAFGTERKLNPICQSSPSTRMQLIERISNGRLVQLGTMVDDGYRKTIVR